MTSPESFFGSQEQSSIENNPFFYEGCDPRDAEAVYAVSRVLKYMDTNFGKGHLVEYPSSLTSTEDGQRVWNALRIIVGSYFDRHQEQRDLFAPPKRQILDRTTGREEYVKMPLDPIRTARSLIQAYSDTKLVMESLK
jgi:hypothetical protein